MSRTPEQTREIILAKFRTVFAYHYAYRLEQGETPGSLAQQSNMSLKDLKKNLLVPQGMTLDKIADICSALAINLDINFNLKKDRFDDEQ